MNKSAKQLAFCGIMTALCIVILLSGSLLGLGIYAAPMFAGLLLIPIGRECSRKYQVLVWIAVSLLAFLFVPDLEEKLIYAGLLGWYPILQPILGRLPRGIRLVCKLLLFNAAVVGLEALLMLVLVPDGESYGNLALLALLLAGNVIFLMYDYLLSRVELLYRCRLRKQLRLDRYFK